MNLEELRRIKQLADDYYYKKSQPFIPDQVYDKVCNDIRELECLLEIESNGCVGSDLMDGFKKVEHSIRMLSIDNVYSINELEKWYKEKGSCFLSIEEKIDGMALSLIYEDGVLVRAVTRGDGEIGDDVTKNAYNIKSIPKYVAGLDGEIRGEVYIDKETFKEINKNGAYRNARNLASGTMKLHNPDEVAKRNLSFKPYQFIEDNSDTHFKSMAKLARLGFTIVDTNFVSKLDDLKEIIKKYTLQRKQGEYDVDGVVIKIADYEERKKYKSTGKYHGWQIAYKFPQEKIYTKLLSVDWQVGRTGVITPVANLYPVEINGTTVKRASLHNYFFIKGLGIYINDLVYVEKSGEIIPEIIGIHIEATDRIDIQAPRICPDCKEMTELNVSNKMIYCPNRRCQQMIIGKLEHFVSKGAMDIRGMSTKTIEKLVKQYRIGELHEIYEVSEEDLENLDGFSSLSAEKLFNEIEKSKSVTLDRLIYSLGVPTIGKELSRELAKYFGDVESIFDFYYGGDDFLEIKGINGLGHVRADKLNEWFDHNIKMFHKLTDYLDIKKGKNQVTENGTVVITGTLSLPRSVIAEKLEQLGYKVTNSITKSTNFLLVGDKPGSKLKKAIEYGTKIINEEDMFKK